MTDLPARWKNRTAPPRRDRCGLTVKTIFVPYVSSCSSVDAAAAVSVSAAPWDTSDEKEPDHVVR